MAEVKWIKITTDMFDNRKIKHLRKLPEGNNIVLIWVMLLTMAGRCNAGGMVFLTENIPYTTKMLADELDFEENTVKLALSVLEQLNMVVMDNGFFCIAGWEEHQNVEGMEKIREQNRLRQKKWYDKQKSLPNVRPNVTLTLPNATDIDIEEDIEKEIDIEDTHKEPAAPPPPAPKPKKTKHGHYKHVLLTAEEADKLTEEYGKEMAQRAITHLDEYIEMKGYKAKSHYLAIRKWVVDAVKEKEQRASRNNYGKRTEPIPDWMKKQTEDKEVEEMRRMYAKTAGTDPDVAARAAALKEKLGG